MSLVRSTSAVNINASIISAPESTKKKCVTFNLTCNELHFYDSKQSIEKVVIDELIDKEFEMSLESGKISQDDMMKELLELCGWNSEKEEVEPYSIPSTTPSDSGGSFTCDYLSSAEVTDLSEPSTPTRSPSRSRSRQVSVSSLKLESLRLNTSPYSRPAKLSRLPSIGKTEAMSRNQSSWWDDISQGIMREDNLQQDSPPSEVEQESTTDKDFWNDVEF